MIANGPAEGQRRRRDDALPSALTHHPPQHLPLAPFEHLLHLLVLLEELVDLLHWVPEPPAMRFLRLPLSTWGRAARAGVIELMIASTR